MPAIGKVHFMVMTEEKKKVNIRNKFVVQQQSMESTYLAKKN